jgi:phosphoglycerate dehydrogenase-like enzyme
MKLLIVLHHRFELWNAPPWVAERLRAEFPQIEVVHLPGYEGIEEEIRDAEVAVAWSLRPEQLAAASRLRWIHSPAAAVHQLMFPELIASDVVVTNARDVHGPVVAEHVLTLIFALAKKLPAALRFQQARVWGQEKIWTEDPRPAEVAGSTLGLVGLGSIGRAVAERAACLGMEVIAVREHPERGGTEGVNHVYGPADIDVLLPQSDYVVLAAPVTPDSRNLMNSQRLAAMKSNAYLINVSRGSLVDEAALAEVLRQRKIAGAALDVFTREPLPQESPLWHLENLLITPHTAAITNKLWQRHYALLKENLRRYTGGEPLLAVVDKTKGY